MQHGPEEKNQAESEEKEGTERPGELYLASHIKQSLVIDSFLAFDSQSIRAKKKEGKREVDEE